MCKILASDYDGTLFYTVEGLRINVEAVKEFIKQGNIFILNTGRPYSSIKKEIDEHNIEYDYLSCTDGSLLLDKDGNVCFSFGICQSNIDYEFFNNLFKELFAMSNIKNIKLYNPNHGNKKITYELEYTELNSRIRFILSYLKSSYYIRSIIDEENHTIHLSHYGIKKVADMLNKKYANKLVPVSEKNCLLEFVINKVEENPQFDIEIENICRLYGLVLKTFDNKEFYLCRKDISKSTTIRYISRKEFVSESNIYTIGDHLNDMEMIQDFNGYTVPNGLPEVKEVAIDVVDSVASLVKTI